MVCFETEGDLVGVLVLYRYSYRDILRLNNITSNEGSINETRTPDLTGQLFQTILPK